MSRPLTPPTKLPIEFDQNWKNWIYTFYQSVKDWGITGDAKVSLTVTIADVASIQVDANATATNTRFLIYDVDNATLERVSVGAADSGGTNFKVLRIPN